MNFIDIQDTVRDAIRANSLFAAVANTAVLSDLGTEREALELSLSTNGFSVSVWPPITGSSNPNEDASQGAEVGLVVRLQINPQQLKAVKVANAGSPGTTLTRAQYINSFLAQIIASVLGIDENPAGVRFSLSQNAFELVNFDEGLMAYHIRFNRLSVFGT